MSTIALPAPTTQQASIPEWVQQGQTVTVITQAFWTNVAAEDRKVVRADDRQIVLDDGTLISGFDADSEDVKIVVKTSQRWGDTDIFITSPGHDLAVINRRALSSDSGGSVA